jgi:hypothetical protein
MRPLRTVDFVMVLSVTGCLDVRNVQSLPVRCAYFVRCAAHANGAGLGGYRSAVVGDNATEDACGYDAESRAESPSPKKPTPTVSFLTQQAEAIAPRDGGGRGGLSPLPSPLRMQGGRRGAAAKGCGEGERASRVRMGSAARVRSRWMCEG